MDAESDDGIIECSIYDLDRAPAPPEEHYDPPLSPAPRRGSLRPRLFSGDSASSSHSPVPPYQQSRGRLLSADGANSSVLNSPAWPSRRRLFSADDIENLHHVSPRHHHRPGSNDVVVEPDDSTGRSASDPKYLNRRGMNFIPEFSDDEGEQELSNQQEFVEDDDAFEAQHHDSKGHQVETGVSTFDDDFPDYYGTYEEEEQEEDEESDETDSSQSHSLNEHDNRLPLQILGMTMPQWCRVPTLNRIAVCVVKFAPCFCCLGFKQPTDRLVLGRLNVILVFMAFYQIGSAIFLLVILLSEEIVNRTIPRQIGVPDTSHDDIRGSGLSSVFWNLNGTLFLSGIVGAVVFISAVLTWRVVRYVNLVGAIRYLWALHWSTPFEAFCAVALFDYFQVTSVWTKHYWRADQMAWFRKIFCEEGTYQDECTVPYAGGTGFNETAWCVINYNSTDCVKIRNSAQLATNSFLQSFYSFSGVWSIFTVTVLLLTGDTLQHIISPGLVQKSKESNIALWLLLPVIGCALAGTILLLSGNAPNLRHGANYVDNLTLWVGPLYLAAAGLFAIAGGLGWYIRTFSISRTSEKRRKLCLIFCFIGIMAINFTVLVIIFCVSILFSAAIPNFKLDDTIRGDIACYFARNEGCSNCGSEVDRCPEWSSSDVVKVLQTQAKTSATLAAIFFVYAFGAFRFGFVMRKHIATYQIEYV